MVDKNIREYQDEDYNKIMEFLESVATLKNIEEELFDNSVLIEEDNKIVGMISYEQFRGRALIRYFIFDKEVEETYLVHMYEKFFEKLKKRNIKEIYVIVSSELIAEMFKDLGFFEFNKDDFYLTETNINKTKYSDSTVMCYEIA